MSSKSSLPLFIVLLVFIQISFCEVNSLKPSESILSVLPEIWSSLAWNKVTLLESSRNQFSDFHRNLMRESSKQNVNLRISFLPNGQDQFPEKITFILRCNNNNDDQHDSGYLIRSRKPLSTLIAVSQNCSKNKTKHFFTKFNFTTTFYLLDIEK
jgi:hypothetical protein